MKKHEILNSLKEASEQLTKLVEKELIDIAILSDMIRNNLLELKNKEPIDKKAKHKIDVISYKLKVACNRQDVECIRCAQKDLNELIKEIQE